MSDDIFDFPSFDDPTPGDQDAGSPSEAPNAENTAPAAPQQPNLADRYQQDAQRYPMPQPQPAYQQPTYQQPPVNPQYQQPAQLPQLPALPPQIAALETSNPLAYLTHANAFYAQHAAQEASRASIAEYQQQMASRDQMAAIHRATERYPEYANEVAIDAIGALIPRATQELQRNGKPVTYDAVLDTAVELMRKSFGTPPAKPQAPAQQRMAMTLDVGNQPQQQGSNKPSFATMPEDKFEQYVQQVRRSF